MVWSSKARSSRVRKEREASSVKTATCVPSSGWRSRTKRQLSQKPFLERFRDAYFAGSPFHYSDIQEEIEAMKPNDAGWCDEIEYVRKHHVLMRKCLGYESSR